MYHKDYGNFVRPGCAIESSQQNQKKSLIDGEQAKKLYLEEVSDVPTSRPLIQHATKTQPTRKRKRKVDKEEISNQKLFTCVENDDLDTVRHILNACPDKIRTVDEYGWSLLMIACQANSTKVVEELLDHGIDTTIRDKAGNSAQSLVIKNKNIHLADILLNHKNGCRKSDNIHIKCRKPEIDKTSKSLYSCTICDNKTFHDKEEHLSSTIHNINASKGKKLPANYIIPESNKGFQIMLRVGWDKESGLGRDGSGTRYPIKPVLKNDKIGLGHEKSKKKKKVEDISEIKSFRKKVMESDRERNRRLEIQFRREFY